MIKLDNGSLNGRGRFRFGQRGHIIQGSLKIHQPRHHRRPFHNPLVVVHKPAEAVLHVAKGGTRLHQPAKGERVRQIERQRGGDGDKLRNAQIGGRKGFQPQLAPDERMPVFAHGGKAAAQAAMLAVFAAIKGDLLGMVAHAQQAGAVIGFAVLAVDVERMQLAPNQVRGERAHQRVAQRHPHQIAVQHPYFAADVYFQAA